MQERQKLRFAKSTKQQAHRKRSKPSTRMNKSGISNTNEIDSNLIREYTRLLTAILTSKNSKQNV
jgi:hypothetical protein